MKRGQMVQFKLNATFRAIGGKNTNTDVERINYVAPPILVKHVRTLTLNTG